MKKLFIMSLIAAVTGLALSSCSGGYSCPTYTKMDDQKMIKTEADTRI